MQKKMTKELLHTHGSKGGLIKVKKKDMEEDDDEDEEGEGEGKGEGEGESKEKESDNLENEIENPFVRLSI